MKKFKIGAVALATTFLLTGQAKADETQTTNHLADTTTSFSQSDIHAMFDQLGRPLEIAALSQQEMKETEGAWGLWGGIIGGVGGLGGYSLNTYISGSPWSWSSAIYSTGAGAYYGATSGPVGVVWGFNSAIGTGTLLGVSQYYGW